jgi:hypothetical protein
MKDDRGGFRSLDGGDHAESAALGRMSGGVEDGVESGFDVGGPKGAAVMEMGAWAKMESVRERVGRGPRVGNVAVEIHLIIAFQKTAEEQTIDFLGLRVGGETRVEIGGVGFDEKG